jgi:hypothetical protein
MPMVYIIVGVILIIGITTIAIKATLYEFVEWVKSR